MLFTYLILKHTKLNNTKIGQSKSKVHTQKSILKKDKPKPKPTPAPFQPEVAQVNKNPNEMHSNTNSDTNNNDINSVECDRCGMSFLNINLLEMHKDKFCIGAQESDLNRSDSPKFIQQQFNSNSQQFGTPRQPLSRISIGSENNFNSIKTQSAINQLKSFKSKKSIEQSIRDMEDTLIRDTIRDAKLATSFNAPPLQQSQTISSSNLGRSAYSQSQLLINDPFRDLLKEVFKLFLFVEFNNK